MRSVFITFPLIILATILLYSEHSRKRPTEAVTEGCVYCHDRVSDPDPSHPIKAFGCYVCHLGNPYSFERGRAHMSMVKNPGDLRVVDRSCGKIGCHPDLAARVKNSVMSTNRGILKILQVYLQPAMV